MMRILNIVYFAWVRERLGKSQERIELTDEIGSIADLVTFLIDQDSSYEDVFSDLTKLRFALDQEFTSIETRMENAEELAIFPPVTGG